MSKIFGFIDILIRHVDGIDTFEKYVDIFAKNRHIRKTRLGHRHKQFDMSKIFRFIDIFIGHVDGIDLCYKHVDIFCFYTHIESTPIEHPFIKYKKSQPIRIGFKKLRF